LDKVTSDDTDERTTNLWKAFLNRAVLRKISERTGQASGVTGAAEWEPALHPRDPRTGQFVERPFDVPDSIRSLDTPDLVRELASEDPDFADKVEGLDIDMDEDLQSLVDDAADGDVDAPDDGDDPDDVDEPDVPDDGDAPPDDGGEEIPTADIGEPLTADDVERRDEVTVLDRGDVFNGTVTDFMERDDGTTLVDVDKDDGSGSTLVGPGDTRVMFPRGTDVPEGGEILPEEPDEGSFVRVQIPGEDDVVGTYEGSSGGDMFIRTSMTGSVSGDTEIPIGQLADPSASITQYDAEKRADVPGVEPLPENEGGLNDIPDDADGDGLAAAIRRTEDWADDVDEQFSSSNFDTDVGNAVGDDVEAGDVVRFTESPDPRIDSTTWEVEQVDDFGRRKEVHFTDNQGHYISHEVAGEDDRSETGTFRYTGAADVQAVAFGGTGDDVQDPTVDEFRDELDAETWEEKVDEFASQANRAYYKMYQRKANEGVEEPILDGYSTTTADEVPSQVHETFQSPSGSAVERAPEIAELYPRLTAAYLEMFDPSPEVAAELEDVDGVTV